MNTETLFSSAKQDWQTPDWLLDRLRDNFGQIGLDPATSLGNPTKASRFYVAPGECLPYELPENAKFDGLAQSWDADFVFCNPVYKGVSKWIQKAFESTAENVVMLLAARPDTKAWQEYILPCADICWIKGRLKFKGAEHSAPFPSALVHYGSNVTKFAAACVDLGVFHQCY